MKGLSGKKNYFSRKNFPKGKKPSMESMLQMAERIKEFKSNKEISGNDFATSIELSPAYISQILNNKREITVDVLVRLKNTFGLSSDYILYGDEESRPKPKEFIARIELTEHDRHMIERTEGPQYIERFVPIPIALGKISGGPPRVVREDPEGVALIYEHWAHNREDFTAVWLKGQSMEPTISDGSLVGIDHSKKEIESLDGKIAAIRKNGEATIKRLRIISKSLVLGLPDNPAFMKEAVVLKGDQVDTAIVGKVAWWWGKQE